MNRKTFLESFGHIADAPAGVDRLRTMILALAVRGSLVALDEEFSATDPTRKSCGWRWERLDQVADVILGQSPPGSTYNTSGEGMPFFQGKAEFTDRYAEVRNFTAAGVKFAERDDILISIRAPIGPTNLAPTRCAIGRGLAALRARALVDQQYLHIAVRAIESELAAQGTGTTFKAITGKKLKAQKLAVPYSLAEQKRIVQRVNELMGLCDELERQQAARARTRFMLTASTLDRLTEADSVDGLRAALRAFADDIRLHLAAGESDISALNRVRQTIVDLAVRGRLTHQDSEEESASALLSRIAAERDKQTRAKTIPKRKDYGPLQAAEIDEQLPGGWEWARAASFFLASDSGWSPQCLNEPAEPGEWGVLKTSAVSRGVFDAQENKKLPPALEPRPRLEVRPGQFVLIRASGSKSLVGRGAIVRETESHLMLSDKHIRLSFLDEASTRFWALLNDSTAVQAYYSAESSGTSTMSNVTRDRIGRLVVAVPPLAEQQRIVDTVEVLLGICDELEQQFVAAASLRQDLSASVSAHVANEQPSAA